MKERLKAAWPAARRRFAKAFVAGFAAASAFSIADWRLAVQPFAIAFVTALLLGAEKGGREARR